MSRTHQKPKLTRSSVEFTENEIDLLAELQAHFGVSTRTAAIKRAIAQSYVFKKHSDEDGMLTTLQDGEKVKMSTR